MSTLEQLEEQQRVALKKATSMGRYVPPERRITLIQKYRGWRYDRAQAEFHRITDICNTERDRLYNLETENCKASFNQWFNDVLSTPSPKNWKGFGKYNLDCLAHIKTTFREHPSFKGESKEQIVNDDDQIDNGLSATYKSWQSNKQTFTLGEKTFGVDAYRYYSARYSNSYSDNTNEGIKVNISQRE